MKLTPFPTMSALRQQARVLLTSLKHGEQRPLSSEVEYSALNLLETFVRSEPSQAVAPGQSGDSGAQLGTLARNYASHLQRNVAAQSAGVSLSPAVWSVLKDVRWDVLEEQAPGMTLMGRVDESGRANLATAPRQEVDWGVEVTGFWTDEQLQNVRNAVQELGRATGTKALNLLREVHLHTHLGDLEHGPILGLTRQPGPVALQREQANNPGATRWLLFHEVGHQLDRYLSGTSLRFRSNDGDTPFGKSSDPRHYVDGLQVSVPYEDFADSHAMAIYHHQEIEKNPDLYIHARGPLGAKMAWVLRNGYGQQIPEASDSLKKILAEVASKRTPFSGLEEFHHAVNEYLLDPQQIPTEQSDWIGSKMEFLKEGAHPASQKPG